MRIQLHHVNLTAPDPAPMAAFYRDVLGLEDITETWGADARIIDEYDPPVAFVQASDGRHVHLATVAPELPMLGSRGHIAFRVDDIAELKRRLDAAGVPYDDRGEWAIKGWHQVFVADPMGNVLEFHEVVDGAVPDDVVP